MRTTGSGSGLRWVPSDERNLSVPCIDAARVLRVLVHDPTALQPEDTPELNTERLPLLVLTKA